ncbi:hypothetical protein MWN33_11515 [Starkeya koreensis]|uniref:Uncharacterized protein n=1 Tax=Ancylobacter koreensis TaxID=266121 RepID=A0ABT0DN82_9HYPH|nr:hypothetical protein [Ancylobacter koreensis]MCK0208654.1 hypothetical protein [Ancylobacter koreensis]
MAVGGQSGDGERAPQADMESRSCSNRDDHAGTTSAVRRSVQDPNSAICAPARRHASVVESLTVIAVNVGDAAKSSPERIYKYILFAFQARQNRSNRNISAAHLLILKNKNSDKHISFSVGIRLFLDRNVGRLVQ